MLYTLKILWKAVKNWSRNMCTRFCDGMCDSAWRGSATALSGIADHQYTSTAHSNRNYPYNYSLREILEFPTFCLVIEESESESKVRISTFQHFIKWTLTTKGSFLFGGIDFGPRGVWFGRPRPNKFDYFLLSTIALPPPLWPISPCSPSL